MKLFLSGLALRDACGVVSVHRAQRLCHVGLVGDVVASEHSVALVSSNLHGDRFGDAGACQVACCAAPKVMGMQSVVLLSLGVVHSQAQFGAGLIPMATHVRDVEYRHVHGAKTFGLFLCSSVGALSFFSKLTSISAVPGTS